MPRFFTHRRVIDRLQQQIAQFPLKLAPITPGDGIGDFISLFNGIGGDAVEILLDIPGAARLGVAQAAHDFEQPFDPGI